MESARVQQDDVGAFQSSKGFSQQAAGELPAAARRGRCVNEDDLQVSRQSAMLHPVVEDEDFRFQLLCRNLRDPDPVGALQVGHVGKVFFEQQQFFVGASAAP